MWEDVNKSSDDNKEFVVSDRLVSIYRNFNVIDQVEEINKLSRRELFVLIFLCLDKHTDDDPVVINNYMSFKEEALEIYSLLNDKGVNDEDLKSLVEEIGNSYVDVNDILLDSNGEKLPKVFTKVEVRDIKITLINK